MAKKTPKKVVRRRASFYKVIEDGLRELPHLIVSNPKAAIAEVRRIQKTYAVVKASE